MASEDRPTAQHLSFLLEAAQDVRRWGLFALVRGAEARGLDLPRVGRARRPSQNIVDLTQTPEMGFPAPTLNDVAIAKGRARISGYWIGLTGPMGPMPSHITEFASYEYRFAKARPFGHFLDLLAGRMLQLFYRAWADSQPAAMADRPDDDRFAHYLSALTGAGEGTTARSAFPARARLHYAALFASQRSARGIEDALTHLLRQKVEVHEFQPRWRYIEPEDRSRLGQGFGQLGQAVLGGRVRTASDAFRVVIRSGSLRDYESLLPTGSRFAIVAEALDAFAPTHLEWDIALELAEKHVPAARLDGRTRLGWTGWLKPKAKSDRIRRDTFLTRQVRKA